MSFPPGPPPPPPVSPQTPWGTREPDPTPPQQRPPGGPSRTTVFGTLAVILAVSLAINVIVSLRLKDETDRQAELNAKVSQLQAEIEALRRRSPGSGASILDQIAAAVAKIRELEFTKDVDAEVLSPQQLRARVEKQFGMDNPKAEIDELDAVLTAFGLIGPRVDLYETLLAVQTEQVAGFYDTKTKKLVVGGNATNPTPLDRVLLAHEYTHALTDQHFDLTRYDRLVDERKDDEALAYLALLEGDATALMGAYAQQYLTPSELRDFFAESSAASTETLDNAPSVIRRSLIFPYEQGSIFVRTLLEKGGMKELDRAYREPPTSTEQILHVTKYTGPRRDDPVAVTVPRLSRTLGSGWKDLESGGIGEFDLRLIVDEYLTRGDSEDAADGWDGGRFAAAQSSGDVVVAALTAWDSETEAREATEILGRWLPDRFSNDGRDLRLDGATGRGWESDDGAGAVLRRGTSVLLILGPDRASVERTRTAFPGF